MKALRRAAQVARGAAVILGCLGMGAVLALWLPAPAPILGMLCLLVLLFATRRLVAVEFLLRDTIFVAEFLLRHIVLFLIPISLGALFWLAATDDAAALVLLLVLSLPCSLLAMGVFLKLRRGRRLSK